LEVSKKIGKNGKKRNFTQRVELTGICHCLSVETSSPEETQGIHRRVLITIWPDTTKD
jgi:hypothetical protein